MKHRHCRSQLPRGLSHRSVGSNPTGGLDVCLLVVLVFSGRGLCDELLTLPEESYWLWCVVVCDQETSWMRRPWPTGSCCAKRKNERRILITQILLHVTSGLLDPELFVWIYKIHVNVKVKITQLHAGAGTEGLNVVSTSTLYDDGWSAPRPGHFTEGKETRYVLYRKLAGPRVDWVGAENLSCNGFRIPDCRESLYQLHYFGRPDVSSFMLKPGAVMKQDKTCVMMPFVWRYWLALCTRAKASRMLGTCHNDHNTLIGRLCSSWKEHFQRYQATPGIFFSAEVSEKWDLIPALGGGNIKAMLSQAGSRTNYCLFAGSFQVFRRGRCVRWLSGNAITFCFDPGNLSTADNLNHQRASQENLAPKCDKLSNMTSRLPVFIYHEETGRSGSFWDEKGELMWWKRKWRSKGLNTLFP